MSLSSPSRASHSGIDSDPHHSRRRWLNNVREALAQFRRKFLPTDAELELEYLNGSSDLRELEYRMRRLDQERWRSRGGFYRL